MDYDKDMRFVERHQPEFDEAWQVLVDAHKCRLHQVGISDFSMQVTRSELKKAVESAKLAVTSVQNANYR